ncbi:hypothetical protein Syun_018504 [Stephania yunnanensis]|uniref:Protein kinase domain-containing protein n=1 Tax=Stephania yunnanensis TaxID=152371 RepID=A0AAP0IU98_9MAGN
MSKEYGKQVKDYELLQILGEGSYGCVWKAVDKHSGEVVAIKKFMDLDFDRTSWKDCLNSREVKALRDLDHPNIVKLKQIIVENYALYLVMECMDMTLTELIKKSKVKKSSIMDQVRGITVQLFEALAHMHERGYFHRDLKPDNILVSDNIVKVADFGMAREVSMTGGKLYTDRVTTLWYRAPEVLVKPSLYGPAVDMWAMGAIMAELFSSMPLFRGSNNVDQYDGVDNLPKLVPNADEDAISLIRWLCSWDDRKRPTALEALQHPFFASHYSIPKSIHEIRLSSLEDCSSSRLAWGFSKLWELVKSVACICGMRKKCIN